MHRSCLSFQAMQDGKVAAQSNVHHYIDLYASLIGLRLSHHAMCTDNTVLFTWGETFYCLNMRDWCARVYSYKMLSF